MEEELDYIVNSFTKTEDKVNLEVDNLNVGCITSRNNNFELDSEGNLSVKSITMKGGNPSTQFMIDLVYPVGSIYMNTNAISPATLFGGTWEPIQDKFLLSSGPTYTLGTVGGESSHQLTEAEIPRHFHKGLYWGERSDKNGRAISGNLGNIGHLINLNWSGAENGSPFYTGYSGEGKSHNNMPPYLTVNVWKRTA